MHRLTPNLTLKIKVKVSMFYTILKIKIRTIILVIHFTPPRYLKENFHKKLFLQKPKNPVLILKLMVKVIMWYTVKSTSSQGMLIGKNFLPNAKNKKLLTKTHFFTGKPPFFWKTRYLILKLKVKVIMLYTVKSIFLQGMLARKNFPPNAKTKSY